MTILSDHMDYLCDKLKIKISYDLSYLGLPEISVSLWLEGKKISEDCVTLPEHKIDPNLLVD